MSMKTILVALALGGDDKRVAGRAMQLADQHQARLIGVHVIEAPPLPEAGLPPSIDAATLVGMVEDQAARQLRALLETAQAPAIIHTRPGKPFHVIESLAASYRADLIVIGPGVAKGVREKVFGSTADHVVRRARCPVLVVRKDAYAPYGHISVGLDFSDHGEAAARWAARLSPTAARELIHAIDIPISFEQAMLKAGASLAEINYYRAAKAKTARQRIIKNVGVNGRLPVATRVRIVHGDAALALLNAARRRRTDLVAIGTQGLNAVVQHLLGSVARRVLAGAKCDVLVVSAAAEAEAGHEDITDS